MKKVASFLLVSVIGTCLSPSTLAADRREERVPRNIETRHSPGVQQGEDCVRYSAIELAFPCRTGEVRKGLMWINDSLEVIEYELIDGKAVFEGDIILSLDKRGNIKTPEKSTGRALSTFRWPGRIVPYTIDANLQNVNSARVTQAIAHWEANTNLRFVQRTTQTDFVRFFRPADPGTCNSQVGRQGGRQDINLGDLCSTGNAIHEIGHAVGLWHEQSRSDRDNAIIIQWGNIQTQPVDRTHNFRTYAARGEDGFNLGAHDFGSIMHYDSWAFTRNGMPTITKLDGSTFGVQRNGLSPGDIAGANYMYPIPPVFINISGPDALQPGQSGSWYLNGAGGGVPPYTYYWYQSTALDGFTPLGNGSSATASSTVSFKIICDIIDSQGWIASNNIFVNVNGGDPSEIPE